MSILLEHFKMETNFEGLIELLAKSLYPEPDVFVRELIQNAHDGIVRRHELEKDLAGRIDVEFHANDRTIVFKDNGIGMDRNDIKEFLAVIGSTGTGSVRKQLTEQGREAAYQLIGQFGIGMLSAFVVAEKVIVRTKKLGTSEAFAWHNTGSTDCELFSDDKLEVGTEVTVIVNEQNLFMLDEKRLRDAIIKYCDFVPYPIFLRGKGPENSMDAPWHRSHWASDIEKEATYRQFLLHRYPDTPLDIIPIEVDEPYRARGVLYISDQVTPEMNTTGVIDIFVRRMFVRAGDNTLLPAWAKFVRGVIDSPDLQPTAARDNVQRQHPSFEFFQKQLGKLIVERLGYLAKSEPNKFRQINRWHYYHLKGMAYYYDDFFDQVADMLLFETNKGPMPLRDYLTKNATRAGTDNKAPIFYFVFGTGSAQFFRLADARGWVVIDAGLSFDEELLEKYGRRHQRTVYLERLDATDDPELFQRLDETEQTRFRQLELDMEGHLRRHGPSNISVRVRRFAPIELPAVIMRTPESDAEQKLRDVVTQTWFWQNLEDVALEALNQTRRPIYLSLNADNALIQKLAELDHSDKTVQEVMIGIYNSASLYAQNVLTQANSTAIHGHIVSLLDHLLTYRSQIEKMEQMLQQERRQMLELRQHQSEMLAQRPDHIVIFMITPFSEEYKPIEQAVRHIFERRPYFFEVMLAHDYTYKAELLDNVREHMQRAHGFVAEITDLNSNVMFELGAAMMPLDGRPVFALRRADATLPVPADFKEKLFVQYRTLNDPPDKLEADIRKAFEKDGRITHDSILALLTQRRKKFLSRVMLEDLLVRLKPEQISNLLKNYRTIEDLLQTPSADVARISGIQELYVQAIQGEMKNDNT